MRRADILSAAIILFSGLVMFFVIIPSEIEEVSPEFVQPSLVPNIMVLVIIGLSSLLLLNTLRSKPTHDEKPVFSENELKVAVKLSLVIAVCLVLFQWVYPAFAAAMLISGSMFVLNERRPVFLITTPLVILALYWLIFQRLLGVVIY